MSANERFRLQHSLRLEGMTATERAAELNEKTRAWIAEDPENRGAFLIVEDEAHWASQGVHTGMDLERFRAASALSDTYKERYNIRPRCYNYDEMSLAELQAETERLSFGEDESRSFPLDELIDEQEAALQVAYDDAMALLYEDDDWGRLVMEDAVQEKLAGF